MRKTDPIIRIKKRPESKVTLLLLAEMHPTQTDSYRYYKFAIHNPDSEDPKQNFNLESSNEEIYDLMQTVYAPDMDTLIRFFMFRGCIKTCLSAGIWIEDPVDYI